tara:strand:- start:483 stop:839 length:357 start_codon:yes stop_codon:yes gene_type:complete
MSTTERFVPVEEVAEHFAVSVSTIRVWIRGGHISPDSYVNIGQTYRFRISDVARSLLENGAKVTEDDQFEVASLQQLAEAKVAKHVAKKEVEQEKKDKEVEVDELSNAAIQYLFDEDM